jgi:hypothetical protein
MMSMGPQMELLSSMPDASRVWVFAAQRWLTAEESASLRSEMTAFVSGWQAHGKDLLAGFDLLFDGVLVVAVDETKEPPSGCSIDKVFHLLKMQNEKWQLDFFQRTLIWAWVGKELCIYDYPSLLKALKKGVVAMNTPVLNALPATLGDFRNKKFISLSDSWVAKKLHRDLQST